MAEILVSAGTRTDLNLLQTDGIVPASEASEAAQIIADTKFALFRRTLS